MKSFHILLVIAVMLMVVPASATILNGTAILTRSGVQQVSVDSGMTNYYKITGVGSLTSYGGYGGWGGGAAGGRGTPTEIYPGDYVIAHTVIQYANENQILYFKYTFAKGGEITGNVVLVPDGALALTGQRSVTIDSYGTWSSAYARIPLAGIVYAANLDEIIYMDTGTKIEYFTLDDYVLGSGGYGKWDTTQVAYRQLTTTVITDPIVTAEFWTPDSYDFRITTFAAKTQDYVSSFKDAANTDPDNPISFLSWLLDPLRDVIDRLQELGAYFKVFFDTIVMILIMMGSVFLGFSALYTAIAIVLSLESSDDIFVVTGKIYRYEMKLFRFYMELFKAVKEVIIWW